MTCSLGGVSRHVRDTRGTVMIEFLLAFMPVFICFLGCVQLVFLGAADLIVRHSAITGARAAVVVLADAPSYYGNEHTRTIAPSSQRMAAIRSAVSFPLRTIAPDVGIFSTLYTTGDTGMSREIGTSPASRMVSSVLGYDIMSTAVTFPDAGKNASQLPMADDITLHVTYLFHCGVPIAAAMFCSTYLDMYQQELEAKRPHSRAKHVLEGLDDAPGAALQNLLLPSPARFRVLRASATLPSQYARYVEPPDAGA